MNDEEIGQDFEVGSELIHKKYHDMNNTEVPNMTFEKREGKLNLNLIKKLNLKRIVETNNKTPLESISRNLIFSEITDNDFNDKTKAKLFSQFQYAIEYLNAKVSKLELVNKRLDTEYNILINNSYKLEEQLKLNKKEIEKNSSEKREKENNLIIFQSIVDFNCNAGENINKIVNNINLDYDSYTRINNTGYQGGIQPKFFCHICNGKFFDTELRLESHMKRRHLAQLQSNLKKQREEQKEEEFKEQCEQKVEETRKYLETLIQQRNEILNNGKCEDEINMIKRENEENMKDMREHTKKMSENLFNIAQELKSNQKENNKNLLAIANATSNRVGEKNEPQKIIIENTANNEINNLTNSIKNLADIIKNKEKNLMEEEEKIIKHKNQIYKLENRTDIIQNTKIIDYQKRDINNNQNSNKPNNYINNNDSLNGINRNQNNIPKYNMPCQQNNNLNDNRNNENNININGKINNHQDIDSVNINDNYKESIILREKIETNSNQEPNMENKNINNILSNEINEQNKIYNPQISNIGNNNNNNVIKVKREESPIKPINIFNKTAPDGFKKRKFIPLEPKNLASSGSLKELDIFYAKYMNRDQPIFEEVKPNPEDYLEKLIPKEKLKNDSEINKDVENIIEKKAKDNKLEFDNFENKRKSELLEIIDKTMKNINEINSNNEVMGMYYDTIQKAIDFKLFEETEKMRKTAYNNKGELKRSRSSSKAKIEIEKAEKEINI